MAPAPVAPSLGRALNCSLTAVLMTFQTPTRDAKLLAQVSPALGNYQSHIVGLLMRTELLDLIHNRSKQYR